MKSNIVRQADSAAGPLRFAAACVGFLLLAGCTEESGQKAAMQHSPPAVVMETVVTKTIPIVMKFPGTVQAVKAVAIVPRVSGYINKRYFKEGTFIEQGAPLYLIDPLPFKARLAARKAQFERDQATLVFWRKQVERDRRLSKVGASSKKDEEQAIAKQNEMLAKLVQDQAEIQDAQLDLNYTNITAPFAGRIEESLFHEGDLVTKQRDTLTTLVQVNPIYVIFSMSLRDVAEMRRLIASGMAPEKQEHYKATVILPTGRVYEQEGHLNYASVRVNPNTDTHTMRAVFPNPMQMGGAIAHVTLQPGEYVPLLLTVGQQRDAMLIPGPALVQSQIGTHVFVVDKNNKVENRKVEVDRSHGQQWVIRSGLKKGERIVVQGVQKVRAGMLVKAKAERATQKNSSS